MKLMLKKSKSRWSSIERELTGFRIMKSTVSISPELAKMMNLEKGDLLSLGEEDGFIHLLHSKENRDDMFQVQVRKSKRAFFTLPKSAIEEMEKYHGFYDVSDFKVLGTLTAYKGRLLSNERLEKTPRNLLTRK